MSVQKVIKFYKFEPQPCMYNNGLKTRTTIDLLKILLKNMHSYKFSYEKEDFSIDIIEITEDFVFGICSRGSELKYTSFLQLRDKETNQTIPYTSESPGMQLESYTYFYIDCSNNRMAAILHKNIAKIHLLLSEFIYVHSGNQLKFFIAPEKIDDVKKAARNLKKSKLLELSFAKGKSKDNIESLVKSLGNIEYESYSVALKLSNESDSLIDKLYDLSTTNKEDYYGIKLIGKNEYGLDETINFIECYYTKNTPFELTDDVVLNTEYIKGKLQESLLI